MIEYRRRHDLYGMSFVFTLSKYTITVRERQTDILELFKKS